MSHGALALLSTQPLTWAASLGSTILLPRLLGSDIFGELSIALTLYTLAATVTGLGISEFLVRRVAQQPRTIKQDQGLALVVQTALACLGFATLAVWGGLLGNKLVDHWLLVAACLPLLGMPALTVLLSSFRGSERHQQYAWLNACGVVVNAAGMLLVLFAGGGVVLATAIAGALTIGNTLVAWKLSGFRPAFPRLDRAFVAKSIDITRAGLPFVGWQITQMAYFQIDRLLLGLLVPASQVGWYAAANRIIAIPVFVPTLITTPLFPALSRSVHAPDVLRRSIAETLRITLLLTVPLSAGTIVVAPVIPVLLGWPDDFANAILPMSILTVQLPLAAIGMVMGSVLMAIGRERRMVVVAAIATVFNIATNFVAIPAFDRLTGNGGIGAAVVTVASEIVMLVGALAFTPRHLLAPRSLWDVARIAVAGVATTVVGMALLPVALALAIVGGAAAYIGVTFVLGVLTPNEVRVLLRLVKRG